jgi:hypothetical protein
MERGDARRQTGIFGDLFPLQENRYEAVNETREHAIGDDGAPGTVTVSSSNAVRVASTSFLPMGVEEFLDQDPVVALDLPLWRSV